MKLKRNKFLRILQDNHVDKNKILFYDFVALSDSFDKLRENMKKVVSCKDMLKDAFLVLSCSEVDINEGVLERINKIKEDFDYFDYDNEEDFLAYLDHSQFIALFLDAEHVELYYKENVLC